jgi:flagellar biosynthesis component FlhA
MRSVSTQRLADCLKLLAADGVPLRNPREIIEATMVHSSKEKDANGLAEQVRIALQRTIFYGYLGENEKLKAHVLDQGTEEMLSAALGDERSSQSVLGDPHWEESVDRIIAESTPGAVIVVATQIRRALQEYIAIKGEKRVVLAKQEIPDDGEVDMLGVLCVDT